MNFSRSINNTAIPAKKFHPAPFQDKRLRLILTIYIIYKQPKIKQGSSVDKSDRNLTSDLFLL